MSPRTGRPPSENPKSDRITVRLDEYQQSALEECAEKFGTSKADVICRGLALMEVEKDNTDIRQMFDAIVILFQTLNRKNQYTNINKFDEDVEKSLIQIEFSYGEFVKSIKK